MISPSKVQQTAPLFAGYLFICSDLNMVLLQDIKNSPGVLGFVAFQDQPEPISQAVIDAVIEIEAQMQTAPPPGSQHSVGNKKVAATTARQHEKAIIARASPGKGQQMQEFLKTVEIVGRDHNMQAKTTTDENLASNVYAQPHRGTRGKGRKIKRAHAERGE
ncbi:hypothetical protein KDK_69000 [Dictyobacter kobayashii]|uniref:NusG-like N-terminal domain-containing protein n=1 Tax=Dictyobacter kobayashii TaxID=2014872 RepID=A0A402AVD2_9CHLR|nr:hypothetical protein KDK_69000 [Dictyobacter kobayashii]